ncbi:MAG: hypothetical protein KBG84_13125 [Planctomycetes bacterium]|jgi:hypothetical protein|nr:hypothetical protein [Planctomycetota bacterium]
MTDSQTSAAALDQAKEPALPLKVTDPIAFAEILIDHEELRRFYKARGVHCFGCGAAEAETFADGAQVHAGGPFGTFDAQKLVDDLNELGRKHPYREETKIELTLTRQVMEWLFPSKE